MNDEHEPLPCPFCGAEPVFTYTDWNPEDESGDDGCGVVECEKCNIKTHITDIDSAIKIWNTRYEVAK